MSQQQSSENPLEVLTRNLAQNNADFLETLRILAEEPNRDARIGAVDKLKGLVCTRIPPGCGEKKI